MDFRRAISVQMDFSGQCNNEITCMHGDVLTPFSACPAFITVFFSWSGSQRGREEGEKGEVLLRAPAGSSAWPRPPPRRHYILLVLPHLATVPQQQSSTATACRVSPMELPLGGPALRHYTQSRPRPHRQKLNYRPSRPQVL